MKNLFVFCCVMFLAWSASAQCYDFEQDIFGDWELVQVPCDEDDDDNGGGVGTGDPGGNPNPPLPVTCNTNMSMLSQITYPCGNGGYVTEIVWEMSCTSGNQGSCTNGIYSEYIVTGCEEVELPPESSDLTTVDCN